MKSFFYFWGLAAHCRFGWAFMATCELAVFDTEPDAGPCRWRCRRNREGVSCSGSQSRNHYRLDACGRNIVRTRRQPCSCNRAAAVLTPAVAKLTVACVLGV